MARIGRTMGIQAAAMCRAIGGAIAGLLLLAAPAVAAESPADMISSYRLKNGEIRVTRDATLDRIAAEQARAMAAQDNLSHDAAGPFARRVAPAGAGSAAENIAYGYESFEKTLGQWIDSSGHRRNLLLHNATRVGIASARSTSKRTYWAMVIAGGYEPKSKGKQKNDKEPVVAVKREPASAGKPKSSGCTIKILSLCI